MYIYICNDLFVGLKIQKTIYKENSKNNVKNIFYLHFHRSKITLIKKKSIKMNFEEVQNPANQNRLSRFQNGKNIQIYNFCLYNKSR